MITFTKNIDDFLINLLSYKKVALPFIIAMIACIFVIDLVTPLGFSDWALYLFPIFFAASHSKKEAVITTLLATGGTSIGIFLSPVEHISLGIALANRVLGIVVLWAIAGIFALVKHVGSQIEKSEARLREAQTISGVGSGQWDIASRNGTVSEELANIFQVDPKTGKFFSEEYLERVHPEDRKRVEKTVSDAIEARLPFQVEHRIIVPDKTVKTVSVLGRFTTGQNPNVTYLMGTVQDISKQKILESELAEYAKTLEEKVAKRTEALKTANGILDQEKVRAEALLESIGEGVIVTDKGGNITLMNGQAVSLLRFDPKEAIGKPYLQIVPMQNEEGKTVQGDERWISATARGKKLESGLFPTRYYVRKDGTRFPVVCTKTPVILNGTFIGGIETFRDITAAKEIDRAKTEFVSLASHQLRTPLSVISMYSELLKKPLKSKKGADSEEQMLYAEEIYQATRRMAELINDLLNVSRIDTQTLAVEPKLADLKEIVESVLKEVDMKIKDKRLAIETHYAKRIPKLMTDKQLLRIAIQNLVFNAIKYTPKRGRIRLAIQCKKPDIIFSVSDTGIGIPEEQQGEIFKKLFRAANVNHGEIEGTGLGLYIARSIIKKLGGSISFTSKEGKGSVFSVHLPSCAPKNNDERSQS